MFTVTLGGAIESSLLVQLREQTRPAHLALEAQPSLQKLLSSQLTKKEYGQLLQSMSAFYQSLESELIPATADLLERHPDPDYRYLPRAPILAEDCRALECASHVSAHPPIELRLNGNQGFLLGVLYVIEGSTQGGRLIARHLADTLDVNEKSGASFFNIHRWDNSWPNFRRWWSRGLECIYQDDFRSITEGANMTFSALHTHLDQWQPMTHER